MKENIEIICKNIGCRPVFDWPVQLARHAEKCKKPASETEDKKYILKGGVYVRCICNNLAHQSNIIRHTKACNDTIRKKDSAFM